MRKLMQPHMLIHLVLATVGVVLVLTGSAVGLILLACTVMMAVMMGGMGSSHGGGDSASDGQRHH